MNQKSAAQELIASSESSDEEIKLAQKQGEALQEALHYMTRDESHGQMKTVGDYIIAWANEKAEGLYVLRDGHLEWQEPKDENTHIEIAICSAAEGRFVPGLMVFATLLDQNGNLVGTHQQPFLWHPWLYHYGRNWQVPNEGPYTLWIRVNVPDFPRHDKVNGNRFSQPVEVQFPNIKLVLGKK
jgi:hypothetical protein